MDRKWLVGALKDIAAFGQMGMYVVVPPILLALCGIFIQKKFNLGAWVTVAAIVLGLMSAFLSIYKLCMGFISKKEKENDKNRVVSFRNHQ